MFLKTVGKEALDHIGSKWSIGIIVAAAVGPIRFTELERTVEGSAALPAPHLPVGGRRGRALSSERTGFSAPGTIPFTKVADV